MKEIVLENTGNKALVDDRDFKTLSKFRWREDKHGYAVALISMARFIKRTKRGKVIDHINRKRLDNRRKNLRSVSYSVNAQNRDKWTGFTSRFRGVYWEKKRKCWIVHLKFKNHTYYLGGFDNDVTAALMYDFWATKLVGRHAYTNFTVVSSSEKPIGG
jgi:hypothetical protein